MITEKLNDSLADLLDGPVASEPRGAVNAPADYAPKFEQKCAKCGGTGQFRGWSGRSFGACFACKGAGKKTFKTSPDERAHQRVAREAKKANAAASQWHAFVDAHKDEPEICLWIETKRDSFDFARKMRESIERFGDLTDNQLLAIRRMIEKDKARAAEAAARIENAPQANAEGIERLHAAFDAAAAYTRAKAEKKGVRLSLRSPRITVGGIVISPAKADSANAGALYVKASGTYLGKIMSGKFFASRECSDASRDRVLSFVADPAAAAKAYGQETGVCCVCNATLKSAWKDRGIGPVCAEKFGW